LRSFRGFERCNDMTDQQGQYWQQQQEAEGEGRRGGKMKMKKCAQQCGRRGRRRRREY
jgi:hypothetical protein